MASARDSQQRWTLCTSCDGPVQVSTHAKSISCPHCNTRVVTEALDVDGYVAVRRFATANRMHITKKGIVFASVRADDLEVNGTLTGDALSMTGIRVGKTAKVRGDLRAAWLAVADGASLSGDLRIGPDQVPELHNLEGSAPDPA
jgi:cytoskeletal protein CcmA (bactofilin family)